MKRNQYFTIEKKIFSDRFFRFNGKCKNWSRLTPDKLNKSTKFRFLHFHFELIPRPNLIKLLGAYLGA